MLSESWLDTVITISGVWCLEHAAVLHDLNPMNSSDFYTQLYPSSCVFVYAAYAAF